MLVAVIIFTVFSSQQGSLTEERLAVAKNEIFRGGDVEAYTKSCLDLYATLATNLLAANGGYLTLPDPHHEDPDIAYYIYQNTDTAPTMQDIVDNFLKYIDDNIQECLSLYNNPAISIIKQSITPKLTLEEEILLSYVIKVRIINENGRIEDREFEFVGEDLRLLYGYRIMDEIKLGMLTPPPVLDLSFTYQAGQDSLIASFDSPEAEPDVYQITLKDIEDSNFQFQSAFDLTSP